MSRMTSAPGTIAPTNDVTLDAGDIALYAESFLPKGKTPIGVVVITHGYAEHCGRYREVAHVLVDAGWAALTYDVRGHGKSPGPRGHVDHFSTYLRDFAAVRASRRRSSRPRRRWYCSATRTAA